MGVTESKSAATPLSLKIQIKQDQTFKMRYIMSMNSNWFQNGQPSKLEERKNIRFTTKRDVFLFFQIWRLAILEPVGVQRCNVPLIKGLIMLKLDFEAQGRGSTFTLCHGHLKKGILSHKRATVRFHLNTAVLLRLPQFSCEKDYKIWQTQLLW